MEIGNVLELIGIIIAVIAIISERNRNYIFLKFTKLDFAIISLTFLVINYLIFYSWFRKRIEFLSKFEIEHFPNQSTWSYFITLLLLSYFVYKIFFAKFPNSNIENVRSYFLKLLNEGEYIFLSRIIEKEYLSTIPEYLNKIKEFKPEIKRRFPNQVYYEELFKKREEYLKQENLLFESMIYHNVILDSNFIESIAKQNPYYFTDILKCINKDKISNEKLFQLYLTTITRNKNRHFKKELFSNYSINLDSDYSFDEDSEIMKSIVDDASVASTNLVWKGVAESAIDELNEEIRKPNSILRDKDIEYINSEKDDYLVTWAIQFIDILVRASIVQKINDHMWLFYYPIFIRLMLTNLEIEVDQDKLTNRSTLTFQICEDMISTINDWISLSKVNDLHNSSNIIDCMGRVIWEIGSTDKFNAETKTYLINWSWSKFVNITYPIEQDDSADVIQKKSDLRDEIRNTSIEKYFNPTILIDSHNYEPESKLYRETIKEAFEKRDKVLYPDTAQIVIKYKKEVIDKI